MPRDLANEFSSARSIEFGAFQNPSAELLSAIGSGARATVSFAHREFEEAGQPAPEAGQEFIVGGPGAGAVVRLTSVESKRFLDIDEDFATNECGSKQAWVSARRKELSSGGKSWSAFMEMYYCRFDLVDTFGG